MIRPPPSPTLFPYTTLFRSFRQSLMNQLRGVSAEGIVQFLLQLTARLALGAVEKFNQAIGDFEQSGVVHRSEEHTSELQSRGHLVCRLLLEKKKTKSKSSAT